VNDMELTPKMIDTYDDCPRKFHYEYIRPNTSPSMTLEQLYHNHTVTLLHNFYSEMESFIYDRQLTITEHVLELIDLKAAVKQSLQQRNVPRMLQQVVNNITSFETERLKRLIVLWPDDWASYFLPINMPVTATVKTAGLWFPVYNEPLHKVYNILRQFDSITSTVNHAFYTEKDGNGVKLRYLYFQSLLDRKAVLRHERRWIIDALCRINCPAIEDSSEERQDLRNWLMEVVNYNDLRASYEKYHDRALVEQLWLVRKRPNFVAIGNNLCQLLEYMLESIQNDHYYPVYYVSSAKWRCQYCRFKAICHEELRSKKGLSH
jgi:CRISPR/Cas system-associated exonuclease Cas4 (RecB family)